MLAYHNRKKSNYRCNNLQVKGPPEYAQPGCKSFKLDAKVSGLVLRAGGLAAQRAGVLPTLSLVRRAGRGTVGIQVLENGKNIRPAITMPGSSFLY